MKKVTVLKRDGSIEEFQPTKIARVVKAAGLTEERGDALAKNVAEWAQNQEQDQISTLQIRNKVLEELEKVNAYAAGLFKWYEKTKTQ